MIRVVQTAGHGYCMQDLVRSPSAPRLRPLTYDEIIRARRLKRATYIFSDLDRLAPSDVELAARLYLQIRELGLKVLNNPARVHTRYTLLRALHRAGINDFQVYLASELSDDMRFPVFVRSIRGHGNPASDLLFDRTAVEQALEQLTARGLPLENLMVIEFVGEPIRPGIFRKLSVFRMGESLIPYICGHERHWFVKQGTTGIAGEELYEEELQIVRDNRFATQLLPAFEIANIEYGRADFGLWQGRPQVFEINTLPHIPRSLAHPSPARVKSLAVVWEKILEGFRRLDSPPGPDIVLPRTQLFRPHQRWSRHFYRSRLVG